MQLSYLPVDFSLKFEKPVYVDTYPLFVFRSILGLNLKKICCISHTSKCETCMYNKTCVYAVIFESIQVQTNKILPGTNRLSHPYSFTNNSIIDEKNKVISGFSFTITLFGKTIEYLPYIYAAFVKAGEHGMFKSRTKFIIHDVSILGEKILINPEILKNNISPLLFKYSSCDNENKEIKAKREILVELKTPLRFKINGKYSINFTSQDFFGCLYRRMKTIMMLYGLFDEAEFLEKYKTTDLEIKEKKIEWKDYSHWSSRQKDSMELGGCVGIIKLSGCITSFEEALLEFNKLANAGKNTNFGLGQIDYWIK